MKLVLHLSPNSLSFSEDRSDPYPWLLSVGTLRLKAHAGHVKSIGSDETPSITLQLDNHQNQVSKLIGRPLRVKGEVYDDAGDLFFTGFVQSIGLGRTYDLTLED